LVAEAGRIRAELGAAAPYFVIDQGTRVSGVARGVSRRRNLQAFVDEVIGPVGAQSAGTRSRVGIIVQVTIVVVVPSQRKIGAAAV